jgi:acyl-coenzyme A synthetase/AMP-(fatty) acid ligase
VMLSHLNGLAFVEWAVSEMGVMAEDRLSSHAPFHFDLSIFDIFASSIAGATVVLVPSESAYFPVDVARFIEQEEITVWYSVPSVLNMLVTRGNLKPREFPALRTVLFAGEIFPTKYLNRLMDLLPATRFCNLYGPTETNVCTWYDVPSTPARQDEPIPIGTAIDGDEVFAITEEGRRAAPGEVGELHVRGLTVMQGYWGDAARTSRSLVPSPLGHPGREPVYRTGDLVVEQPDGTYRLLGRRDHQIKSRGYRVELGEIETALYAHPAVVECAVVAVPDPVITNRIKAFVVARGDVGAKDLARFCIDRLPRHMIPERFEFRPSLPKTSTGKVDRQALTEEVRAKAG